MTNFFKLLSELLIGIGFYMKGPEGHTHGGSYTDGRCSPDYHGLYCLGNSPVIFTDDIGFFKGQLGLIDQQNPVFFP